MQKSLRALKSLSVAAAAAVILTLAPGVQAARQVHFQGEFTPTGPAGPGWSYLWNENGPLGTAANYAPLVRDSSGDWETVANAAYPDPAPGNALRVSATGMVPGAGASQSGSGGVQRYAIAAYTIQPSDIIAAGAAPGGSVAAVMDEYSFSVAPELVADGIDSVIYVNDTQIVSSPLPPGISYDQNSIGAYPVPLGNLSAGDTIYIATGAGFLPTATDTGDLLTMDFKVTLTPEPGAMSLAAAAAAMMLGRRRRTR